MFKPKEKYVITKDAPDHALLFEGDIVEVVGEEYGWIVVKPVKTKFDYFRKEFADIEKTIYVSRKYMRKVED